MNTESKMLLEYIEIELKNISNKQVVTHIHSLLVMPKSKFLEWDYGEVGQKYLCWIVLEQNDSPIGIAYCNEGFGPKCPWGLVSLNKETSIGMDCDWFPTFIEAYVNSAASEIPIWCIVKEDANGHRLPITSEGDWDAIWAQTMVLRDADPDSLYHVETFILGKQA